MEIQAAIGDLGGAAGDVELLGGTFSISDTILVARYVTLEGVGYETVLYLVDDSNCDVVSNLGGTSSWKSNVTIRNLRIDGNKEHQSAGSGISRSGYHALYENLWVENCYKRGISHNWGDYTRIVNNVVRDCDGRGVFLGETYEGEIVGNLIENCGITPGGQETGNEDRAISIYHGGNNRISDNHISGGGYNRQIGAWDSPYVEIRDNTLQDGLFMGIAPHSQYATIIGNTITGCGENAIDLCGEDDCWVEGNFISGVMGGNENSGICMNTSRTTAVDNYIEFCGRAGIHLGNCIDHRDNYILNNTIRNCGQDGNGVAGIWLQSYTGNVLSGTVIKENTCFDDQETPTQHYGVLLSASEGCSIDDVIIEDNYLQNNGTCGIEIWGESNILNLTIRSNAGYITENSGTATIASGSTSVAIDHGLDVALSDGDVVAVPTTPLGNATEFWAGDYTSTRFILYVDSDPGQDIEFTWDAEYHWPW
ncbi:MAG: right-handed parallel beta-helix repeat-containing protein [Chloroflexota bacterium]|nr:right-handed parallel beta-helix repeat-containing protein [Chloroflexota bacterium]